MQQKTNPLKKNKTDKTLARLTKPKGDKVTNSSIRNERVL